MTALDVHHVSYRHDGCAFSQVGSTTVCSVRAQVEGSDPEPFMISFFAVVCVSL